MPQYLVCNYIPDDFDPSTVTEAMMEEIHALNREMIAAGVRKFVGDCSARERKDAAEAVRRQGACHRRAIHRDQGAHGRFLDTGSRQYGRGARVGAQGCHRLRHTRRGTRASFLPGSGGRTRRKQVNGPGRCGLGSCAVVGFQQASRRFSVLTGRGVQRPSPRSSLVEQNARCAHDPAAAAQSALIRMHCTPLSQQAAHP